MDAFQKAYEAVEDADSAISAKLDDQIAQARAQLAIAWALVDIAESLRESNRIATAEANK